MANTNIDNILTIAPELTTFLQDQRQIYTCTVTSAVDDRDYTISIDKIDFTIDSGAGSTVESIAAALKVQIDLASLGLDVIDNLDGSLTIYVQNSEIRNDIDTHLDRLITTVVTQYSILASNLFRLILEDVKHECMYEYFRDDQERAQRYLAAHYLTVLKNNLDGSGLAIAAGSLTRRKVGNVETWFSDGGLAINANSSDYDLLGTIYGRTFLQIKQEHRIAFI